MIMFDNVTVTCDRCGSNCYIGVNKTYDGIAEAFAYCPKCNGAEIRPTDEMDIKEQLGHDYESLSDLWEENDEEEAY